MIMNIPPAQTAVMQPPATTHSVPTSDRDHTHMLTVFSVSAGMVGVCLTAIGLIQVMAMLKDITTICDEILVLDALFFLFACLFSYWALHHRFQKHFRRLRLLVDSLLMAGIVTMAVVCGLIAYTITERPPHAVRPHMEEPSQAASK